MNQLNKFYISLALCLFTLFLFQTFRYKSWQRYYYDAFVTAPATYPVHVRECYFITDDGDDIAFVRKESVNQQESVWGERRDFLEISHKMRLPKQLILSYVSYRDQKMYTDTLDLPTQRIKEVFDQAINNKNTEKYYSYKDVAKGLSFMIGIANNGDILVWLQGVYFEELILKTNIKPKEPTENDFYFKEKLSKQSYFEQAFSSLSDSVKLAFSNGYDAHAIYADSATHYMKKKKSLWDYQKENGFID